MRGCAARGLVKEEEEEEEGGVLGLRSDMVRLMGKCSSFLFFSFNKRVGWGWFVQDVASRWMDGRGF